MPLPSIATSRCVLVLGDEAVYIYNVTPRNVRLLDTIPWDAQTFEAAVAAIISSDGGGKPVLLLYDTVEQHYRKERVPKVSPLDKGKVIRNRLRAAFQSYPIRASLPLAKKGLKAAPSSSTGEGGAKGAGGDLYLFSAIPVSENFIRVMAAVEMSLAPLAGLVLLPVESASMVEMLSRRLTQSGKGGAQWHILVGQHHGGGLRQIVVRDGELALTRMTPIVDTDADPALWAREVAGEFKATMSYLTRFGYSSSDGLETIIVANRDSESHLEGALTDCGRLHVLTARQAADRLGIKIGRQDDLRYADPLHAAWSGRKAGYVMPMKSARVDAVALPRKYAKFVTLALGLGVLYFGFQLVSGLQSGAVLNDELEGVRQQLNVAEQDYQSELDRKKEMGFDVMLIRHALAAYDDLKAGAMSPLPIVQKLGVALGPDLRIDTLSMNTEEGTIKAEDEYGLIVDKKAIFFNAVFKMTFSGDLEPEVGVKIVSQLAGRLRELFPDYEVDILKQVADLSVTGNFAGEVGRIIRNTGSKEYVAELAVRGLVNSEGLEE